MNPEQFFFDYYFPGCRQISAFVCALILIAATAIGGASVLRSENPLAGVFLLMVSLILTFLLVRDIQKWWRFKSDERRRASDDAMGESEVP